jgi:glycosyltransferase involved in cell wall biosynthesis
MSHRAGTRIVLFANTDWYLFNFRRALALALRERGFDPLLISPPGEYGQRLRALGYDWRPVPMDRRSLNPFRELALVAHLTKLIRQERPALVHNFTIKCAVYGSLAARFAGVPARVNAIAGLGYVFTGDDLRAAVLRPVVRTLLGMAFGGRNSRLIVQNPDDAAEIARLGLIDANRVRLIRGSGVDCRRFVRRTSAPQPNAPLRVLLASRLLWSKGLAEYVDAARILKAEGRRIQFLIAGVPDPGNPESVPGTAVEGWAKDGLVQWLAQVDDMPALLADVDVVAHPSFYGEGVPRILIEAAACALALVTTDVPGCREVVTDGVNGLRVPARDATALAAAIRRLADDPPLRARLGAAARETALQEFDERIVIDQTLAVYRELLPSSF